METIREPVPRPAGEVLEPDTLDVREMLETLRRRWPAFLGSVLTVTALTAAYTLTRTPVYEASARVLVRYDRSSQAADLLSTSVPSLSAFADQRDVQTEVQIVRSWPILSQAAAKVGAQLPDRPGSSLRVEGGKDNNVITITARSTEPTEARAMANAVARVYVDWKGRNNRSSARAGRQFLEEQQKRYARTLQRAGEALRDYQKRTGGADLDAVTQNRVRLLADLEAERTASRGESAAASAQAGRLRKALAETDSVVVATRTIARNPAVARVQDEIAALTAQRAAMLKDYAEGSSRVRALDAQLSSARERQAGLVAELVSERQEARNPAHQALMTSLTQAEGEALAAAARTAGLDRAVEAQQAVLASLPDQQYRLAQLKRDVQVAEKTYLALQDRYQSLRIAEASTLANAQVLEPARTPTAPVSPRKGMNLAIGIVAGLLLGALLAALWEALDDKLRDTAAVERSLGLPVLGVVGRIADTRERSLLQAGPRSALAEALRLVRSNIRFMAVDRPLRSLVVTSATTGEGKTTTAANLAIAVAQDGRKVLLVDSDLRRPSLHRHFDVPASPGLTTVIAGGETLEGVARKTAIEGLTLVTAGPQPPNPAELLGSERVTSLVAEMTARYDAVVFDAPPLLGMADAGVLAELADGVVLVVAAGEADRSAVLSALSMLRQARAVVLGVVLNKQSGRDSGYYYHYYENGRDASPTEANGKSVGSARDGRRR